MQLSGTESVGLSKQYLNSLKPRVDISQDVCTKYLECPSNSLPLKLPSSFLSQSGELPIWVMINSYWLPPDMAAFH